jgi:hypothetical protein
MQSEVARAIAAEVRAQLTPQEQGLQAKRSLISPDAYDLYLRGKVMGTAGRRSTCSSGP